MQWTTGTYVSAAGHLALVIWLITGWGFQAEPLPFEISEVSVVSSEEYAQIVAATTPDPSDAPPEAPVAPPAEVTPETPTPEPVTEAAPVPEPATPPAEDLPPPPAPDLPDPVPPVTESPALPGPAAEEVVAAPNVIASPRPVPRPATRVASEAVQAPPPDATPDEVRQDQATPDAPPEAPVVEQAQEQTAPEEAATEIVTEAEKPAGIVTEIPRPKTRPKRPTPAPAPDVPAETRTAEATPPATDADAITAALEAAEAATAPPAPADVPQGPPMTGSEREGFRVAVNRCWNVDPGSQAARVTMTVAFDLDQNGKVSGDIRQVGASGGDDGATRIAFDAARRAILRCQGTGGYDLPAEKYSEWRQVEITFDPSGMRMR